MTDELSGNMSFTKLMRATSRDIHSVSDTLVNAKLGMTASNNRVWREGIAIFYQVFKFLERECLDKVDTLDPRLKHVRIEGMEHTGRFEADLEFYYGANWREAIEPLSPQLTEYIGHLGKLRDEEPVVLSSYVYHMYMGLFAGGQILKRKRTLVNRVPWWLGGGLLRLGETTSSDGLAVVSFDRPLGDLKRALRRGMEDLALILDDDTKKRIIEEGLNVFKFNNSVVRTIKSADEVLVDRLVYYVLPVLVAFASVAALFMYSLKTSS